MLATRLIFCVLKITNILKSIEGDWKRVSCLGSKCFIAIGVFPV